MGDEQNDDLVRSVDFNVLNQNHHAIDEKSVS